ncbi:hypothetical protein K439DRAFT_1637489 [Ramaria rubella]|nr:hypothetical protein K439DRAFT_1637489 [Ramaria rubella]
MSEFETAASTTFVVPTFTSINPSDVTSSCTSSTPAVTANFGQVGTTSEATERRIIELATFKMIGVAVAGAIAANLLILTLWLLLRRGCSRKSVNDAPVAVECKTEPVDDKEKEKSLALEDIIHLARGENPGLLAPGGESPADFDIRPPPSTHQPLPLPLSSFWSAASSQWTLERARSNRLDAHLDDQEGSRHFTAFDLDTPVNPHLHSPTLTSPSGAGTVREGKGNSSNPVSSPNNRQNQILPLPSALHRLCSEFSTDPRSPRRLSIPLFMENYSSPNVAQYPPPQTQSTIIIPIGGGSYDNKAYSMLQNRESSHTEVEFELGRGSIALSANSMPSVSSEVMAPRRHWTFVDIHGPAAQLSISPDGRDGISDRISGMGSSQAFAIGSPIMSTSQLGSSSRMPLSEPPSSDSFLHTNFGASTASDFLQSRSVNSGITTDYDHSIRTH